MKCVLWLGRGMDREGLNQEVVGSIPRSSNVILVLTWQVKCVLWPGRDTAGVLDRLGELTGYLKP